jgi:hypothetical protein
MFPRFDRNLFTAIYYDIGIAVSDRVIEFTQKIRPICLPFQPVDGDDYLEGKLVSLVEWEEKESLDGKSLHIYNLEVT